MSAAGRNTRLSNSIVVGLTVCMDIAIVFGLSFLIYKLYLPVPEQRFSHYLAATTVYSGLVSFLFNTVGLYRFSSVIDPTRQIGKIIVICGAAFLCVAGLGFALKLSELYSRVWGFSLLLSSSLSLNLMRIALARLVTRWARQGRLSRNILIYGGSQHGARLLEYIENLGEPWNRVVGIFDERSTRVQQEINGHPLRGNLEELLAHARAKRSDEILIALPWTSQSRIYEILQSLMPVPANIRLCPEIVHGELLSRPINKTFGIPMLSLSDKPMVGWGAVLKSMTDYVLTLLLLLPLLPLLAVIAVLIKLESPGPVLFSQRRYGFNNDLISVLKFRTMYVDSTDEQAERLVTRGDSRVTKVGAVLRRYSLDELPQIFNVLKGEMSLVGPRPHALKAKAAGKLYDEVVDTYAVRHKVKPGITGWAQVNGWRGNTETEADILHRVEHDLFYIENWSILLDFYIMMRTVGSVLIGKNSY